MKRFSIARIEFFTLLGILLGLAGLIVGIIGVVISVNVSRGETYVVADCAVKKGTTAQELEVNADRGDLYWKLENTSSTKNEYKVQYKAKRNSTYGLVYSGKIGANDQTFWLYASTQNVPTVRFFRAQQCDNLSSTTSHFYFYLSVH